MNIEEDCICMEEGERIAGFKQVTKSIINKEIKIVYLSIDCDSNMEEKILCMCKNERITVIKLYTQKELGRACSIDVNSAVVGIKK